MTVGKRRMFLIILVAVKAGEKAFVKRVHQKRVVLMFYVMVRKIVDQNAQ